MLSFRFLTLLVLFCFVLSEVFCQEYVINDAIGRYRVRPWSKRSTSRIRYVVVHHSVMRGLGEDEAELRAIQRIHVNQNGWPGISYHYVIMRNGNIYQVNAHNDLTWTDRINVDSVAILVHGYFHSPVNQQPTDAQLKSLSWLTQQLLNTFGLSHTNIRGHRDRSSTACPGDILYPIVSNYRYNGLPSSNPPPPPDNPLRVNSKVCLRRSVNMRTGPCTNNEIITLVPEGGSGTVRRGPVSQCGYHWYEMVMGPNVGWMANGQTSGRDWIYECGEPPEEPTPDSNEFRPGDEVCLSTAVNLRASRCGGRLIVTVPRGGRGTVNGAVQNQPVFDCGFEWYYVTMGRNVGWMARGNDWLIRCLGASTTDANGWDNSTALAPDEGFPPEYYSDINETEINETLPLGPPDVYVGKSLEDEEDESIASLVSFVGIPLTFFLAFVLEIFV